MQQFKNRTEAGLQLAEKLSNLNILNKNAIVMAIPRGGVPIAYEIAKRLKLPLEIILVKKIGAPGYSELAVGSVSEDDEIFYNTDLLKELGLTIEEIEPIKELALIKLQSIARALRSGAIPISLAGKNIIIVDDGIATGSTMEVVIKVLRKRNVAHIVIAAPVAAADTVERLYKLVDEIVVLKTPDPFFAVGEWYTDFTQVQTDEVIKILKSYMPKNIFPLSSEF